MAYIFAAVTNNPLPYQTQPRDSSKLFKVEPSQAVTTGPQKSYQLPFEDMKQKVGTFVFVVLLGIKVNRMSLWSELGENNFRSFEKIDIVIY